MIVNGPDSLVTEYLPSGAINPGFWARGYDLTSIGHDPESTQAGQWGTLIQTTGTLPVILSASHYYPQGVVNFTNASGQMFTYSVSDNNVKNIGGTDLFLTFLTAPVDPSIHAVAIAPLSQVGQSILSVGYYFRAGQNTIASTNTQTAGLFSWNYNPTTPLSDMLQAWDGGGPTYVEEPGGLALAGIHDAISGVTSFDTDVTALIPAINAALASAGLNEQAIVYVTPPTPEPSSLCLVGIGLAAWYAVRRRLPSRHSIETSTYLH